MIASLDQMAELLKQFELRGWRPFVNGYKFSNFSLALAGEWWNFIGTEPLPAATVNSIIYVLDAANHWTETAE